VSLVRFRVRAPLIKETSLTAGFLLFWSETLHRTSSIIRPEASPCGPTLKRCSIRRKRRLSESGTLFRKTRLWRFFCFLRQDSSSNKFDYSAKGLTLRANAKALFNPAQAPVVRVRAPLFRRTRLWRVFCFLRQDSSSNTFDYSARGLPCGPTLKRCSIRRKRRLSESGTLFRRTRLWRVFCFLRQDASSDKFDRTTLLRIDPGRKLPQFFREDLAQRNQFIRCLLQFGTGLNRTLHAQTGTAAF
jgi:hypothetical protein